MNVIEITVQPSPNVPHYDTTVRLDGLRYRFAFYTCTVDDSWYFDLETAGGDTVLRGVGLSSGVDLLYPYRHLDVPPGPLWVHDQGLFGADPDVAAFADGRAALYYGEGA